MSECMNTCDALARLAQSRDGAAWSALLDRQGAAILRAANRVSADRALCDDICQETLLQILAHADEFQPRGNSAAENEAFARGWIMRIACCTALKMMRGRSRTAQRETECAPAEHSTVPAAPEETALKQEEAEQVRREVSALPEPHRDAVALRFFGELAYAEIGATLQISEEAAKKRVQRGLDLLRARLATAGVALSATLLVSVLQQGATRAAEGAVAGGTLASEAAANIALETLDLSRRAAWQALVNSSQSPVLTGVVLSGGATVMTKAGIGIAAAALLALGLGGGYQVQSANAAAEQAAAAAAQSSAQVRALETKLEGNRNEIDALRRVVESRNSELTSLREKVAELDKRNVAGPHAFAGLPVQLADRMIVRNIEKVIGPDGKETTTTTTTTPNVPQHITFFADAEGKPGENGVRQIEFPGGKVMIQMNANGNTQPFNVPVPPPAQGVPGNAPVPVPDAGPIRLPLPPGVVPPAPPAPAKNEREPGNF